MEKQIATFCFDESEPSVCQPLDFTLQHKFSHSNKIELDRRCSFNTKEMAKQWGAVGHRDGVVVLKTTQRMLVVFRNNSGKHAFVSLLQVP